MKEPHQDSKPAFLQKRLKSFGYAFAGIATFFSETVHAKVHLSAAVLVVIAGLYFHVSATEWIALIICIGAVWSIEAINSSIEYVVDLVSPSRHPLAKKAKDVAAAGVLLASIAAAIVGLIVFVPKVMALLQ